MIIALAVGSPQLVAFSEIAGEVERSVAMSPGAMLATSLTPSRVAEIFFWPVHGFLNDPGGLRQRLFSTVFLGIIALPALWARSRYAIAAAASLFFALGGNNPVVDAIVRVLPEPLRIVRYPEKLMLPLTAALVVLIALFLSRTRFPAIWSVIAIAPLLWTTWRALPIDRFAPYRVEEQRPVRVHWNPSVRPGEAPAREEYRTRAAALDWMFGAVAGLRYGVGKSPDGMHALLTRAVVERYEAVAEPLQARYLRINGCSVEGALPMATIVPATIPARSLVEAVNIVESPQFEEHRTAVAPIAPFRSAEGRVTRYREDGQTVRIGLEAGGPVLLLVNQTFFEAWVARSGGRELETFPLDIDRLGIIVPSGTHEVTLTFGRRRALVVLCWVLSIGLLVVSAFPRLVEKLDRRPGQVERSADENGAGV